MKIFTVLLLLLLPAHIFAQSLTLTDKTWKDMLCGQWMVEFYAPWCPSCQNFKPTWDEFSKEMVSKEIKVAAVDINEYPSLSGRFGISVLPTIYYVRDGVFRQFNGERSLKGLKNYIEFQEWKRTQPVSSHWAPDSIPMSIVGSIFDVSLLVRDAYTTLKDQYGWPAWLIYIILALAVITVGLVLGFGVLMLIDYCLTGSSKVEPADIPDDSRDGEDIDDDEDQRLLRPKKPTASLSPFATSSTPQRPTGKPKDRFTPAIPIENEEELMGRMLDDDEEEDDDEDDNNAKEDLNASDVTPESGDDDEPRDQSLRQRRGPKRSN